MSRSEKVHDAADLEKESLRYGWISATMAQKLINGCWGIRSKWLNPVVLSYFQQQGKKLASLRHFWLLLLSIPGLTKVGKYFGLMTTEVEAGCQRCSQRDCYRKLCYPCRRASFLPRGTSGSTSSHQLTDNTLSCPNISSSAVFENKTEKKTCKCICIFSPYFVLTLSCS